MAELPNGNGFSNPGSGPNTVTLSRKTWNWITILGSAAVLAISSALWSVVTGHSHHSAAIEDIRRDDERLDREFHEEMERMRSEISKVRDRQYSEHAEFRRQIHDNKNGLTRHEAACAERHARESER